MLSRRPSEGNVLSTSTSNPRSASSYILPQPTYSRAERQNPVPTWISTSSRPAASGSGISSPRTRRITTSQPPPLPPPPPSPQLVPLQARLSRSRSIASRPVSSRPETHIKLRKVSDGGGTTRPISSSSVRVRSLSQPKTNSQLEDSPLISPTDHEVIKDEEKSIITATPSAFLPIAHPTERNAISVCLASLTFLSFSLLVTSVISILLLPLCLLAGLIRRIGTCFANVFQASLCCQCGRSRTRLNSDNMFYSLLSHLPGHMRVEDQCCCASTIDPEQQRRPTFTPLTAAELRWLPVLQYDNTDPQSKLCTQFYSIVDAPVVVVCLRFGAPGIRLSRLCDLIQTRLLSRHSPSSSIVSTPRDSCFVDKASVETHRRQRTSSLIPPLDTRSRLTQCLTSISTGYAWTECMAFRLEDHVSRIPSSISEKLEFNALISPKSGDKRFPAEVKMISVEKLVNELGTYPMRMDRPLWKAHLVEQYYELENTDPSDAESDADSDEQGNSESGSLRSVIDSPKRGPTNSNSSNFTQVNASRKNPTGALICRRSGASGVGSLVIFRLHAALSDDGKAVVHLLTSCLADSTNRTQSPLHTPRLHVSKSSSFVERDRDVKTPASEYRRKWRGYNPTPPENQMSFNIGSPKSSKSSGLPTSYAGPNKPDELKVGSFGPNSNKGNSHESSILRHKQNKSSSALDTMDHGATNEHESDLKTKMSESKLTETYRPGISSNQLPTMFSDEDDPEESEAAQWWYTFWASSLATIATFCDLIRAILTGPAIILHRYFLTQADMGILVKNRNLIQKSQTSRPDLGNRTKYACTLLSLAKMSRIRQVTKASYAEIILSLLAGGLRAYHQIMGLKHPPDLLALLATEVPVLPGCSLTDWRNNSSFKLDSTDPDTPCPALSRIRSMTQRMRPQQQNSNIQVRHEQKQPDGVVETGLLGSANRMVALGPPPTAISSLRPGRHVLADICLPINTEGMLPRLWETRQRLIELNTSVDALCLAWTRTVLYTLLPHSLAKWFESSYGGPARSSVCVAEIEVVSPFSGHNTGRDSDGSNSYQMPRTRRLAYMSLLANKSAEARVLRRRLCKRLPRGVAVYPPRLGTSFRALARHLVNANAGIVYISGSPIIRIDTWMPSATDLAHLPCQTPDQTHKEKSSIDICRNLSVTFTTYAGQLSVSFSAGSKNAIAPNLELISQAMTSQLNKMCRLLSGRHVPSLASRWLHRGSGFESAIASSSAVNMSPSLNPSLTLHSEAISTERMGLNNKSSGKPTTSQVNSSALSPSKHQLASNDNRGDSCINSSVWTNKNNPDMEYRPIFESSSDPTRSGKLPPVRPIATYALQDSQPIEQLQDRLRWVQQQLEEASTGKPQNGVTSLSEDERLTKLRSEFCILLKHLKQRCNQSEMAILASTGESVPATGPLDEKNWSNDKRIRCISKTMSSPLITTASELLSVKSKLEQYATGRIGGTTGDFDEDPDFCINGYNEADEEFEDELESGESDFRIDAQSTTENFNFQTAVCVLSDEITGTHQSLSHQIQQNNLKSGSTIEKRPKERKSRKNRRKSSRLSHKRRSSFLSRDVKALDFTPNRRGSLTTPQTMEKTGLLVKFLKKTKGSSNTNPI